MLLDSSLIVDGPRAEDDNQGHEQPADDATDDEEFYNEGHVRVQLMRAGRLSAQYPPVARRAFPESWLLDTFGDKPRSGE